MEILVLDTIHGGTELAIELTRSGHRVDTVDIYRGERGITPEEAADRRYDLLVAPVHLNPDHPLLKAVTAPRITHHGAVRMLLSGAAPHPMIEVTGARGKTTTAHAIAHALGGPGVLSRGAPFPPGRSRLSPEGPLPPGTAPAPKEPGLPAGPGILHTSRGTFLSPEGTLLWKRSITPASVIRAAREAARISGWLVAEESLGVSGAGDVAVLTSGNDYRIAAGKRSALAAKLESMRDSPVVVVPPGYGSITRTWSIPRIVSAGTGIAAPMTTTASAASSGTLSGN